MPQHPRGAYPSPRHKLAAATPHIKRPGVPDSFGIVPKTLQMWGNDTYGDCVSAEEAASKAMWSVMNAYPELLIPDQTLIDWARQGGYLNGANLTDVMDSMISTGITVGSTKYTDGPYQSVDWTKDDVLSSAIITGPVKLGIAANQISNVFTAANGWFATGFRQDNNEDHCVPLWGFGPLSALFAMLGVPLPSGANPTARGYLMYTWQSIGVIDQPSLIAITGEAWLRMPTTPQQPAPVPVPPGPNPPPPPPPPPPNPTPGPGMTVTGTMTGTFTGTIQ